MVTDSSGLGLWKGPPLSSSQRRCSPSLKSPFWTSQEQVQGLGWIPVGRGLSGGHEALGYMCIHAHTSITQVYSSAILEYQDEFKVSLDHVTLFQKTKACRKGNADSSLTPRVLASTHTVDHSLVGMARKHGL